MTHTTKHTPGPWAADGAGILYAAPSEADEFEVIEINAPYNSQDRQLIAQVHAGFKCSQANAALIAAAPTMYADLCAVRDYLFELYDEGNAKAGEYAASLGITIEQAEGQHHE